MSSKGFFVLGASVWFLVACYRERMRHKARMSPLPGRRSAQVIDLAEWKASRDMPH